MNKKIIKISIISCSSLLVLILAIFFSIKLSNAKNLLIKNYLNNQSEIIKDRHDIVIKINQNNRGDYSESINFLPKELTKALIEKEDKTFYFHPGINLKSTIRAFFNYFVTNKRTASSTITQQLAKILLSQENERTFNNKIKELFYTFSLESYLTKAQILQMYENSIYFGNNIEGIKLASIYYFNTTPELLNKEQINALLTTMPNPARFNPFAENNNPEEILKLKSNFKKYINNNDNYFELSTLLCKGRTIFSKSNNNNNDILIKKSSCPNNITTTIDSSLTDKLREILNRNLESLSNKKATNGAIIVLKYPENEILSIIGSPDPKSTENGAQINMATQSRPIGSTIKPFIYVKGFEKNLRPYTVVEDKEYKYLINDNFAFYPKNYDYQYRGLVNLHYSLSNSLNVPTVKVLEYYGINNFYNLLTKDLELKPTQDISNYQLGIALGGLEMDLVTLSYYFSIFSQNGNLLPLKLSDNFSINLNSTNFNQNKNISEEKYIELINKILSDRKTGIDQFGSASDLNVEGADYAVKTGTSREFHDSYTIGYTKDFLVAVWVGNSDNTAMEEVSGQTGAGRIWHEAMNLIINSEYNKKSKFEFNKIKEYNKNNNLEYGLASDDYNNFKNLLTNNSMILKPHNNDEFELEKTTQIPLQSDSIVKWYINNEYQSTSKEYIFQPETTGLYKIKAIDENEKQEEVNIYIN